jgi:hypothetical protein
MFCDISLGNFGRFEMSKLYNGTNFLDVCSSC